MITSSAAVNAFRVSTPRDGEQSSSTTSYAWVTSSSAVRSAYSRPGLLMSWASVPASSIVAGSRSMPSSVCWMAIAAPTRPSSTSWTLSSIASGSRPREKVRQDWASRSTRRTLRPCSANAAPSDATLVVLATPPFWFATAMVRVTGPIVRTSRRALGSWSGGPRVAWASVSTPPFLDLPEGVREDRMLTPRGDFALLTAAASGSPARPPVVLVPGFTGSKEDFIAVLAPIAAAGHPVTALDQRGQFQSPGGDDPTSYD